MKINHILKFRTINRFLIDSLVHSRIYFARPETLNDPFDCQVDVRKSLENAITQSSESARRILERFVDDGEFQKVLNKLLQELNNFGVFSGSHKPALAAIQSLNSNNS